FRSGRQPSAAHVRGAALRSDREVATAEGRKTDGPQRADGESSGGVRRTRPGKRMPAALHIDRAVLRGRATGLHQASPHVLRANDARGVGTNDVQARGPSSAAVWGLAEASES